MLWESYTLLDICTVCKKPCRLFPSMSRKPETCSGLGSVSSRGIDITSNSMLLNISVGCRPIWGTPTHTWLIAMMPKLLFHLQCTNWGSYYMTQHWPNGDSRQEVNIRCIKIFSRSVRYLSITSIVMAKSLRICWIWKKSLRVSPHHILWKTPLCSSYS